MPDCHNCKYNGHPTRRCLSCRGPSAKPENPGQHLVPLDSVAESDLCALPLDSQNYPETQLKEFMRQWLRMPANSRDLLAQVIVSNKRAAATVARARGISRQAVSKSLRKIAMAHPELMPVLRLRLRILAAKGEKENK